MSVYAFFLCLSKIQYLINIFSTWCLLALGCWICLLWVVALSSAISPPCPVHRMREQEEDLLSPSFLDFGGIVLASSCGLRQTSPKTEQIWGSPVCAEVCAITAVLQTVLRYSLKCLFRNVCSHYTHSSVNTPLKQM